MTKAEPTEQTQTRRRQSRKKRTRRRLSVLFVLSVAIAILLFGVPQIALLQARKAIQSRNQDTAGWWLRWTAFTPFDSAERHYLAAIVHRRDRNFPAVEKELTAAHELGWPTEELQRQNDIAQAQAGQFADIATKWGSLFQAAGSDGPEICQAYVEYALSRLRLQEAAAVLEMWKADFPHDPAPYLAEAKVTSTLQRWSDTVRVLTKAVELGPDVPEARVGLAEALIKQQKFAEAEKHLRTAVKLEPSTKAVALLAHAVTQQGRADEAEQLLSERLAKVPDDLAVLAELGRLKLMQGDSQSAIEALENVMQQRPSDTELRYQYAQALRNAGREADAAINFQLVDRGTRELLRLATLTDKVVADPDDVESRFSVAEITWKWKSREAGFAWLRSVIDISPGHQGAHELLARHYQETGDARKAEFHRKASQAISVSHENAVE